MYERTHHEETLLLWIQVRTPFVLIVFTSASLQQNSSPSRTTTETIDDAEVLIQDVLVDVHKTAS